MSCEDLAKRKVAEELRRFVLMRGGADTLDTIWNEEADTIISIIKQKQEKTIYHILHPKTTDINTLSYELNFLDIAKKIDEAEQEGYKPTQIVLCLKGDLGNIYGLPARLKLIE